MSTSINVQVNGQTVTIKSGEKLEDVKKKLANPADADTIFEGVDANSNGKLDAGELQKLKTNLENNNYTVEVAEDGKTPRRAYNDAMQNLRNSYNSETLAGYFKTDDADLHPVRSGETLYTIAKKQLAEEGLPTNDFRAINNRIAQIANLNNINDVNNIKEGVKLKVKLTDEAIKKVKENNNDSAKAFNGIATAAGDDWTKGTSKKGQTDGVVNDKVADYKKQPTLVDGKTSTIKVTKNGLNMGSGICVDAEGNELAKPAKMTKAQWKKYQDGGCIMKYSNPNHDPQEMYQTVYSGGKAETAFMFKGIKLSAPTVKDLKDLVEKFKTEASKIKTAPANETAEAKAKRMATNLAALKELVTLTGGNEQVIKNVAEKLRGDDYVDRKSDDYKAFVQDLLLTRNADVVSALTPKDGDKVDMSVVEYDRTSHETLAGMYQEILEKEKAGEKLSADEIKLKDALVNTKWKDGFKIEADEANHVNEKYLQYGTDGRLYYTITVGDTAYWASDKKVLDDFVNELKLAKTDEAKAELFKKYANTKDVELARCLLTQAKTLKASDEDIKTVINANGMEVLAKLDRSANPDWSDDIKNAMNARIKDIYTKEKGNLENAEWLDVANGWIKKLPEEQRDAARTEIAETYFEKTTTKDDEGNDKTEYTFNPTRRPTKEEMEGLLKVASDDMKKAMGNYIKLEDMGKGQFNEAIESTDYGAGNNPVLKPYADMVDGMSDKKEVLDFIDNKIATDRNWHVPYDKILEKFPDDKNVKDKLLSYVDKQSTISDENRLALVKTYMKEENGKVSLDKTKLPKGASAKNVLNALPQDCKTGDAAKYFTAALKELGKDDLDYIKWVAQRNENVVKARIAELVKANMTDKAFIQEVCKLDDSITPYQALYEVDANKAKWDDKTKQAVFEKIFNNRIKIKDKQKYLDGAVKNGLIQKVTQNKNVTTSGTASITGVSTTSVIEESVKDRYIVGDKVYLTDCSKDGNNTMSFLIISKAGYDNGANMYNQLKGAGSGDTAKMLKGEGNYANFVTADNVAGLIQGFNDKSPNEGMMQYIANEWTTISQATCNVIPKKLMEKAKVMGLDDLPPFKKLEKFVKSHSDTTKGYSEEEGKQLDALINDLKNQVLYKS